jgi:phospholipid/cholesterol/gamma-HCH transport system ATP-binding protein
MAAKTESPASDDRTVLTYNEALLVAADADGVRISIDARISAGDLVLVHPGDRQHERGLIDGTTGRRPPASGGIRFLGHDWRDLRPDQANALRGLIGVFPAGGGWLPHLSVVDNLLLASLHHTRTPYDDLRDEAAAIAVRLGLPGLPLGFPDDVAPLDLLRAGYVRVFLGAPRLILLESAHSPLLRDLVSSLVNTMRGARDRGCAVLWSTLDAELFYNTALPANQRLHLRGERLLSLSQSE